MINLFFRLNEKYKFLLNKFYGRKVTREAIRMKYIADRQNKYFNDSTMSNKI